MPIPANYFSTAIAFSKATDIAKAYMLDPKNGSATILLEVTNPPQSGYMTNNYYYTVSDTLLATVRDLSTTDAFGASSIMTSFATLSSNIYTNTKTMLTTLLNGSATFYTMSDITSTKYNSILASVSTFNSTTTSLKTQCTNLMNTVTTTKNNLPANQPSTTVYNAVITAYTNIINCLTYLSSNLNGILNSIDLLVQAITNMKELLAAYLGGECTEAEYASALPDYCHNAVVYSYYIYRTFYCLAKITSL